MKYRTFMTIHTIALAYFGLATTFIPVMFWGRLYGLEISGEGLWTTIFLGIHVLVNMVLSFACRSMEPNPGRRAILTTFSGGWLVIGIVFLYGQLTGVYSLLNWSNVVVSFLFSAGLYINRNKGLSE